jgi:DNA replication initiation complex subunit (GINS family)
LPETTLEDLKRHLDSESESPTLLPLSADFYSKLSLFSQRLKRSAGFGASEGSVRLIAAQNRLIESMTRALLGLRISKAMQTDAVLQLLPEERYVCSAQQKFKRRFETLVAAISAGRPSTVEFAHRNESERSITVRFAKHIDELVGLDLRHYGPFEVDDVASIPAASADILISSGDAVEVFTSDEA